MVCRLFTRSGIAKKLPGLFSMSRRASSSSSPPTDWNSHSEFFDFTGGARWVCNEEYEMGMRHVPFDMNELAKLAAQSVGAAKCVDVENFGQGLYNKPFLFTMDDGTHVIGKVPNLSAGLPHFTTASEVATMDFARNFLGTPVPKVLAWSSRANENPVGAEFILMEFAPGIPLSIVWDTMGIEAKCKLIMSIGKIQNTWASTTFSQYGSLYYASDLDRPKPCLLTRRDGSQIEEPRFAVGPSNGRYLLDDGRLNVSFDRGPWDTVEQYKRAIGYREISCVQQMAELPLPVMGLYGPRTYTRSRPKKLAALNYYLQLINHLLPTDPSISSSFLWHNDLHVDNIFVNPQNPWEILSIIDWQSVDLRPLFDHTQKPFFLDYDGPSLKLRERPKLPENLSEMSLEAQKEAKDLHYRMELAAYYKMLTYRDTRVLHDATEFTETKSFDMMLLSQKLAEDGEAMYQWCVKELEAEWSNLPGVQAAGNPSFPFHFSSEEVSTIDRDAEDADQGMELMRSLKQSLGNLCPEKGLVRLENYDAAKALLRQKKEELMAQLGCSDDERRVWDHCWPFDN
ncbi:unnamed protein product [Penicillium pancosmium]